MERGLGKYELASAGKKDSGSLGISAEKGFRLRTKGSKASQQRQKR